MNIDHRPVIKVDIAAEIYSEKDGVPVRYVCTSEVDGNNRDCDIFYRETPHPEFGNRYFYIVMTPKGAMIGSADSIEDEEFVMVEYEGSLHYSRSRHDFYSYGGGAIDGGRAYCRRVGGLNNLCKTLKIVDGNFVEVAD